MWRGYPADHPSPAEPQHSPAPRTSVYFLLHRVNAGTFKKERPVNLCLKKKQKKWKKLRRRYDRAADAAVEHSTDVWHGNSIRLPFHSYVGPPHPHYVSQLLSWSFTKVFCQIIFHSLSRFPVPQTNQLMHIYPQRGKGFSLCVSVSCVCVEYQKTGCRRDKINYLEKRKTHYWSRNRNTFQNKTR